MRCLERTLPVFTGITVRNNNFYRIGLLNVKRSYCVSPSLKEMDGLDITDMRVEPCVESQFIKTSRVVFKQNGRERKWDYVKVHDSVCALLFNTTRQAFVLVKQFRPAVYMNINRSLYNDSLRGNISVPMATEDSSVPITAPFSEGITYELCAGIIDQNMSPASTMKQEILEECGYDVPEEKLQQIVSFRSGVGSSGALQTFFFAEITDDMCVSKGGGNMHEGEIIEVFYLPLEKSREFVLDSTKQKPAGFLFAFMWYFDKFKV
ncbi:uridine diphosphate glucose pyrophosphatase NUDT14-like [Acropora palmata]|uniref:uridine diphosphate glucose pyrophosphatase NUDT14-like n=1 Tax=Acropora palmata TaxID=6131 RepID=UPI003DA0715A